MESFLRPILGLLVGIAFPPRRGFKENLSKIIGAACLLLLPSIARGATDPLGHVNPLPPSLERIVQNVTGDLKSRGYEVERGFWTMWGIDQCKWTIEIVGNCLGNNPTAPYVLSMVPAWRDEFVDRKLHLAFGPQRRGYSPTYRLGEREALVVLGLLPPPGAYFGLQTYVFTREGAINPDDPVYQRVLDPELRNILFATAPNASRVTVFASIGNSNNNVVIENQSGSAFDQERFFIVTPDAVTERDVTESLLRAGVPDRDHVFLEPVSRDLVNLGLGPGADDFLTTIRYALPFDGRGEAWRERLPLAVLRVRDRNSDRATEPYPVPVYDARSATSELPLNGDLRNLIAAVKQQWQQPEAPATRFLVPVLPLPDGVDLVGQHCLERPMNCLGDTQDTDSYRISRTLSLDGGEIVAVVGTLATATENATYVSLAVNRFPLLEGVANLTHLDLEGTASAFSESVGNTDKFYVYYLARNCSGLTNCLTLPESVVPKGETIKLLQRNYVRPGTARGAAAEELLSPSVIVLNAATPP